MEPDTLRLLLSTLTKAGVPPPRIKPNLRGSPPPPLPPAAVVKVEHLDQISSLTFCHDTPLAESSLDLRNLDSVLAWFILALHTLCTKGGIYFC